MGLSKARCTPVRETSGAPDAPAGGDLVDFVDVDDAVLGQLQVVVGGVHQVPHQVFHVPAHVTRLAELGGVALHKGGAEFVGDELDEVGLPHPRGTDEDDVILDGSHPGFGFPPFLQVVADAVKMGADLGGEDALGVFLLDDILAEVGLQLFGLQVKLIRSSVSAPLPPAPASALATQYGDVT